MHRALAHGWIPVFFALTLSCAPKPTPANIEQELLDADRAFLEATIEQGLAGWLSFFTTDAMRVDIHGQTVIGLEEIRAADAPLFEPGGIRLRWEPAEAIAFADGNSGITRGPYTLIREAGGEPEIVNRGVYLTLWRRENGRFKVYLDTGAPDPPLQTLLED